MFEFRHGRQRRLLQTADGRGGRHSQPQGHRQSFLVVEEEWWELASSPKPVTTAGPSRRPHRVTEIAQPGDVPSHRSRGDLKSPGQFLGGPIDPSFQQSQELQEALGAMHLSVILEIMRTETVRIISYGDGITEKGQRCILS